jgi:glycine/D-amino acid oxidase-like deaminating enzyme
MSATVQLPDTGTVRNGGVSFWYASSGGVPAQRRPALPGDLEADVAIVGGGYTGLWTAYYLKRARPSLNVVVLEKEFAGFGASGRNGGWLSGNLAGKRSRYAETHGRERVVALQRAMFEAVDEVIRVAAAEGIDADIVKGGILAVARSPAQVRRLRAEVAEERAWGATQEDLQELTGDELAGRVRVAGALAGTWGPHCARVQPAKLVRGLAAVVERLGVPIYEDTTVTDIRPREAVTNRGTVGARHVLRCLEGFSAGLTGEKRTWLPMNSSMIVTEPLSDEVWARIGWKGAELLGDRAHAYMYAQRTADGRIALGGRGVPYRYGSRWDDSGATQERTIDALRRLLHAMFPATAGARIEHAWCGVLGVPRDWCATVHVDPVTGLGWAGGYVGHGVTTTNLAGRTLCDLVLGERTERTDLPWVGRQVRRWEPEPLRFIGVRSLYALYRAADRREYGGLQRTSSIARFADRISGK